MTKGCRARWLHAWLLLAAPVFIVASAAEDAEMHASVMVQEYFSDLEAGFRDVASARVVGSVELSATDEHFVDALESYPGMQSLFRTNSKGVVINEVIRGEQPERVYRSIAKQQWYRSLRGYQESHRSLLAKNNGDRQLLWAEPIVVSTSSGATRYGGAVGAKISLQACARDIGESTDVPFELWIEGRPFYSHEWTDGAEADSMPVTIPGLDDAFVVELRSPLEVPETLVTETPVNDTDRYEPVACGPEEPLDLTDEPAQRRSGFPVGRVTLVLLLSWAGIGILRTHARRKRILNEIYRDSVP